MQRKIMVVGDAASGKPIVDMLSSSGYEIVNHEIFYDGLNQAQSEGCKIILLRDTETIFEQKSTIKIFKENALNKWLPVIVLTMDQDSKRRTELLEIGIDEVIVMPISKKELLTRIKKWYQKSLDIEDVAFRDKLTKAYNRRYFDNQVKIELARSLREEKPLSIAFIDLDKFKSINDTFGHDAGDAILVGVSQFLINSTRITDVVTRFGGEEFVVLFTNSNGEDTSKKVHNLLEMCREQPFLLPDGRSINVTFSSGVAQWSEGLSIEQWIKVADEGVYEAKKLGRNQVVFNQVKAVEIKNSDASKLLQVAYIGDFENSKILSHYQEENTLKVIHYDSLNELPKTNDLDLLICESSSGIDYKLIKEMQVISENPLYVAVIGVNTTRYEAVNSLVNGIDFYIEHPMRMYEIQGIINNITS